MKRIRKLLPAALLVFAALDASAASFKVVANSSVTITRLSKKEISDLFMKKTPKWPDGTGVVAVDQNSSAPVREDFSRAIHGKSTSAVKSTWNQLIFSGRDVPPIEKASEAEVLAFVRATPGAVGYVSDGAKVEGLHVIQYE